MFLEMVRNYYEMIRRSRGQAAAARGHKKGSSHKPIGAQLVSRFESASRSHLAGVGSATNQRKTRSQNNCRSMSACSQRVVLSGSSQLASPPLEAQSPTRHSRHDDGLGGARRERLTARGPRRNMNCRPEAERVSACGGPIRPNNRRARERCPTAPVIRWWPPNRTPLVRSSLASSSATAQRPIATLRAETVPSTKVPVLGLDITEEEADKNPAGARSAGLHGPAGRGG
jgi:hypothetical protein